MKNQIKFLVFLLIFVIFIPQTFGQSIYFPYYGKNKVNYTKFQWKSYKTDNFDIYYYTEDIRTLKIISELAESAFKRISLKIKHQLSARVPILFYKTSTEFQQTNLYQLPEGVLGVAEPLLYRVALHGDMPIDELQDLVEHELTHIFEYDLLYGSPGGVIYAMSAPAGWIMEGFSEYNTETWSSWSALIVRDAVLNDRIPELTKRGSLFSRYPMPRPVSYDFGHAMYEFIEHKYGKNGVRNFWQSLKNSPMIGRLNPIKRAFNLEPKEFGHEFKKYIRDKYKHLLLRDNPEDYSITMGPEFPLNEYWFAFSHALSPSGDIIAVETFNVKDNDFDILLLSAKDGTVIKNLTKGYTLKYEHIKYEIEPSKGRDIAWSSDGDRIAFFARTGKKHSLFIIDALSGNTLKKIFLNQDRPASPCFDPKNNELFFTAFEQGIHDIFKLNLDTKKVINLTQDDLYEKALALSPDGSQIAYSIRIGTYDKLFLSPVNNLKEKTQLTFGRGNTITPEFSPDAKTIYFSGDMREAYNIYSVSLDTGELKRYTDVRTGNFFPIQVPNSPDTFVFASFNKGSFQIFKSELEGEVEKTVTFAKVEEEEEYQRFEPLLTFEIDKEKIKPYKGIGKLYMAGRPPIDAIFSTDGGIYGGSSIAFSDIFRDHTFSITAYQVRSFRSYSASYFNQKRRLQFMASAFRYTMYYYTPYSYMDPSLYYRLNYRDAIATRTISGANVGAYYPFSRYYRVQATFGYSNYAEDFFDPYMNKVMGGTTGYGFFWNGSNVSGSLSLVGETTKFKNYGPAGGNTFKIGITQSLPIAESFIQNTTLQLDFRQYLYIGADALFAFRFNGFASLGKNPYISYFGGNNQVRSANYYSLVGNEGWYSNLEFRIPLINYATTLLGQIGPIRGTFFLDMARIKLKGYPAQITILDYLTVDGENLPYLRRVDAVGSYGFGIELFFLGFPVHLDFVKALDWSKFSKPFDFNARGDWMTKFWIGFDF